MKRYITAQEFSDMGFSLGKIVFDSGFVPTFIVALWRGGAPVGMNVQEFLKWKGINADHIAIRTSSYVGETQNKEIRVHGLDYLVKHANSSDRVLIVDDVFDSGNSIKAVFDKLERKMRNIIVYYYRKCTDIIFIIWKWKIYNIVYNWIQCPGFNFVYNWI
jgi:hypoxanthine phosphoribosyltransferase